MRRVLAVAALVLLVVSSGCAAFGPRPVNEKQLQAERDYGPYWNSSANVTIVVGAEDYSVLYRIHNRSELEVFRFHRLNNERPIDPIGLQFRYPNGTVVGADRSWVDKKRSRTTIALPARNGTLAMAVPKQGKRIRVATVVPGPYEVILPPDARVRIPLMGRVIPRGYDRSMVDGRVHLYWDAVRGDRIVVRYYLVRDLYLFGGLLGIGAILGAVGLSYFFLQLRTIRRRREEVGLDVETGGDDSGPGPF